MTGAFLIVGPIAGTLSDRLGTRGLATGGMVVFGASFIGLLFLPVDFPYWAFALLIVVNGIGVATFSSPNSSSIMGSVPVAQRGAASGMRATFQNTGTALSIAVFFSLMVAGLASSLPKTLSSGLQQHGVPPAVAHHIGGLPPVSSLFASVLGVNPVHRLLVDGGVYDSLSAGNRAALTGRRFFPRLISAPFHHGLTIVFIAAAILSFLAALASLARGPHAVRGRTVDAAELVD
jgi:MFS family permease